MVFLGLIADELVATERVERLVLWAISAQELIIRQSLHRLRLIELDAAVINSVADLSLITHRVGITKVNCRAIAHESFHLFLVHPGLIDTRERSNLDLGLDCGVRAQAECRHSRVARVPEVVICFHDFHVNAPALIGILRHLELCMEPISVAKLSRYALLVR